MLRYGPLAALGTYRGEPPIYQNAAAISYAENFVRVYNEFREVYLKLKPKAGASGASVTRSASAKCPRLAWPGRRHVNVLRGHRARVRIRFSRATVRALVGCAGPHASFIPVRVFISISARPRPVVRFIDIPLRIKHR